MKRLIIAAMLLCAGTAFAGGSYDLIPYGQGSSVLPITGGLSDTVDTDSFTTTKLITRTTPNWYVVSVYADTDIYFKQAPLSRITIYNDAADTTATVTVSDTDIVLVTTGNDAADGTYTFTFSAAAYNTLAELVDGINGMTPDIGWVAEHYGDPDQDSNDLTAATEANALLVANIQTLYAQDAGTTNCAVLKQNEVVDLLITGDLDDYVYHQTTAATTVGTLYVRYHTYGETGTQ
jgi:hypothetical protein